MKSRDWIQVAAAALAALASLLVGASDASVLILLPLVVGLALAGLAFWDGDEALAAVACVAAVSSAGLMFWAYASRPHLVSEEHLPDFRFVLLSSWVWAVFAPIALSR